MLRLRWAAIQQLLTPRRVPLQIVTAVTGESVAVTTSVFNGQLQVLVNGAQVAYSYGGIGSTFVPASDVRTISVEGFDGNDVIDLSAVTYQTFPALENVGINEGSGNDTIYGTNWTSPFAFGDINLDGSTDAGDISAMQALFTNPTRYQTAHNLSNADFLYIADINRDGTVNAADLQALLILLKPGGVPKYDEQISVGTGHDTVYISGGNNDLVTAESNNASNTTTVAVQGSTQNDAYKYSYVGNKTVVLTRTGPSFAGQDNQQQNVYLKGIGNVLVDGSSGSNTLTLDSSLSGWTIAGPQFSVSSFPTVTVQNIQGVTIQSTGAIIVDAIAPGTGGSVTIPITNGPELTGTLPATINLSNATQVTVNGSKIGGDEVDIAGSTITVNGGSLISLPTAKTLTYSSGGGNDTIRVPSWSGIGRISIHGSSNTTVDLSGNTNLQNEIDWSATATGISNVASLNLSNADLSTLPTFSSNIISSLTTLDLRYDNFNLGTSSSLSGVTPLTKLSQLYLYGNPSTVSGAAAPSNLQALQGMLLRVDLEPDNLAAAENIFNSDGSLKTQDQVLGAIAKTLHYLPLEIFDYVYNNYSFQAYSGAMKGILGVVATHAGNDFELSQLLEGLLKQCGVNAELYTSTVNPSTGVGGILLTPQQAAQWLGVTLGPSGTDTSSVLAALNALNGETVSTIVNGEYTNTVNWHPFYDPVSKDLTAVAVTHTWVQVTIGNQTLVLDPSFKFKSYSSAATQFLTDYNSAEHTNFSSIGELVAETYLPYNTSSPLIPNNPDASVFLDPENP